MARSTGEGLLGARRVGATLSGGAAFIALLLSTSLSARPVFAATTERASLASDGSEANGESTSPAMSDDGRYVAFHSDAADLVAGDTNGVSDVFLRDRQTGETIRVSVATGGIQADDGSYNPSISSDGRYVAFDSDATDLVVGDTNWAADVFVHDVETGETTRVSVTSAGAQGDDGSYLPAISGDGRYVAFESDATDLVLGDLNFWTDIFVHDRVSGETTRVSVSSAGAEGDDGSYSAAISSDARYVAFDSDATNLVAGDTNAWADVFVHDLVAGETTRVSVSTTGVQGDGPSYAAALSGDGRYVAFDSDATNLVAADTNVCADVFVRDCQSGVTTRVSVSGSGVEGNAGSVAPALSADGGAVCFESDASNLVTGDANGATDVFVHDLRTGGTKLASVSSAGTQGDGDSAAGRLSGDGQYAAFESAAANLVAADTNGLADVFVRDAETATLYLDGANGQVSVNGVDRGLPWSGAFNYGAVVTLEAIADDCWQFEGWSGDLSGSENPTSLVMLGDRNVTVNFISDLIFPDVPCDHWAAGEIAACYNAEIVGGYPDGTYQPALAVTRDQMAVYIARALSGGDANVPTGPAIPSFPDVLTDNWAFKYVEFAVEQNVVKGYEDLMYHPEYEVTRDQMAVYVARALVAPSGEAALEGYVPADPRNFPDVNTEFWAYSHIEYCVENGVVQGYPDGYYHPEYAVTRDQMAVYIARAFGLS